MNGDGGHTLDAPSIEALRQMRADVEGLKQRLPAVRPRRLLEMAAAGGGQVSVVEIASTPTSTGKMAVYRLKVVLNMVDPEPPEGPVIESIDYARTGDPPVAVPAFADAGADQAQGMMPGGVGDPPSFTSYALLYVPGSYHWAVSVGGALIVDSACSASSESGDRINVARLIVDGMSGCVTHAHCQNWIVRGGLLVRVDEETGGPCWVDGV